MQHMAGLIGEGPPPGPFQNHFGTGDGGTARVMADGADQDTLRCCSRACQAQQERHDEEPDRATSSRR